MFQAGFDDRLDGGVRTPPKGRGVWGTPPTSTCMTARSSNHGSNQCYQKGFKIKQHSILGLDTVRKDDMTCVLCICLYPSPSLATTKVVVRPGVQKKVQSDRPRSLQKLQSNHLKTLFKEQKKTQFFCGPSGGWSLQGVICAFGWTRMVNSTSLGQR